MAIKKTSTHSRKTHRRHHSKKSSHTKSKSHRSPMMKHHKMKGGNLGANVLPPAYFGGSTKGYFESGSPELNSCGNQIAVSQGVVHPDGMYAGPNLFPMKGGKRGGNRRSLNNKSRKSTKKHTKKHSRS